MAFCDAHEAVGLVNKIPIYASFNAIFDSIYFPTN
jgi:hypothetical protein